ncbi:MAG: DUF3383 family protein [Bilophila wadsworthia]
MEERSAYVASTAWPPTGMDAPEYRAAELYFSSPPPAQLCVDAGQTPPQPSSRAASSPTARPTLPLGFRQDGSFAASWAASPGHHRPRLLRRDQHERRRRRRQRRPRLRRGFLAWDGQRFAMKTSTLGASAGIGYLAPLSEPAGTDISPCCADRLHRPAPVAGTDGETAKEAVAALADKSGDWYGCVFADEGLAVEDHLTWPPLSKPRQARIYGVTVTDSRAGRRIRRGRRQQAQELARKRTIVAYSRNPYAIVSALGRAFTVNFSANRSTITLKFKQLPGVVAEGLTETQAQALEAKRCNVFAAYDNDTAIFQEGVMSGPAYFDEIHGLDWLQNTIQSETWNLLTSPRPRSPDRRAAPTRSSPASRPCSAKREQRPCGSGHVERRRFRLLERGDYLDKGYYVYTTPVAEQAQSEREQRKCPPIQIAAKLAGAIHFVDVQIDVNR